MKNFKSSLIVLVTMTLAAAATFAQNKETVTYKPKSQEIYNTVLHLDSVFFNAYNTCDLKTQADMLSDSMEFYHDETGLMTSKKDFLTAMKNNICGKVSRVLVPGSIEAYEIKGFGAVEIGYHRFINHHESETPSGAGRFVAIWKHTGDKWQLYRVASMHAGN
ncbi:MAG: nuclear transport factor 2 family protein [Bacteroidota bacterium]